MTENTRARGTDDMGPARVRRAGRAGVTCGLLALLCCVVARAEPPLIVDTELVIGEVGVPGHLNPLVASGTVSLRWSRVGHQYPTANNPLADSKFVAELLASADVEPSSSPQDGTLHFRIRPDAVWASYAGKKWTYEPVTAEDVAVSWQVIKQNPASTYFSKADFFASVTPVKDAGAPDIRSSRLFAVSMGKRTVGADALVRIATQNLDFPIVQAADITERKASQRGWYVGSGPYQPERVSPGDWVKFRANPRFSLPQSSAAVLAPFGDVQLAEKLKIERIADPHFVVQQFDKSDPDVHIITEVPLASYPQMLDLQASDIARMYLHNSRNFSFVGFDAQTFPRQLRLALTHAVDRAEIFGRTYGDLYESTQTGQSVDIHHENIVHQPYPESILSGVEPIRFDRDETRRLVQQLKTPGAGAGSVAERMYRDLTRPGRPPLRFVYFEQDETDRRIVTEISKQIMSSWGEGEGIRIAVEPIVNEAHYVRRLESGAYDMFYQKWSFPAYTDVIRAVFTDQSPLNYTHYNVSPEAMASVADPEFTPDLNTLMQGLLTIENPDARQDQYAMIAETVMEHAPYLFLFRVPFYMAFRTEFVEIPSTTVRDFNLFHYMFTWKPLVQ